MGKVNPNVLIGAIVAVFIVLVIAITCAFLVDPDRAGALATVLVGFAGSIVATLALFAKVSAVDQKVDYLANGGTDAKIRAGIADVVKPELLRDDVDDQLDADREHRDASPAAKG